MGSYHQVVTSIRERVDQFLNNNFVSIIMQGPKLDVAHYQQQPLMFACTHRSHMDYILVGHNLHLMGFQDMRFAAGDNLTKLPVLGPNFKAWGAFAVSRDTGFERNYVRNLCNSVISMMDKKEPVVVFPEGGRSYSGSMLDLKVGILGAAVLAQARDLTRDVYVVPMAISYESFPDLPFFEMLLKGKKLRKRTNNFVNRIVGSILYFGADLLAFLPLLFKIRIRKKYGTAYLDYKAPVSVRSLVDIEGLKNGSARDDFSAHRDSMQKLSDYLQKEFFRLYRILPSHIVAGILEGGSVTMEQAVAMVSQIVERLKQHQRNVSLIETLDASAIVKKGVELLKRYKAVSIKNNSIIIKKKHIIDYYCAAVIVGG